MKRNKIYHICPVALWESQLDDGTYTHPTLVTEGFIHCSEEHQLAGVLDRYFMGQKDIVRLSIASEKLESDLRYELAPIGEKFPHVFGPINKEAIIEVVQIR